MSLHVYGESFKDEVVVRGSRHLGESERHPLYRRQKNHTPLRISNQNAFDRFMQQCYEEAERKARLEDAREREVAAREGRPYRSREERERVKKEKEEKEKREQEERKRRGESGAGFQPLKTFDATRAYYQTLGVDENASSKDIKKAYKRLALKYHPDKMRGKTEDEVKEAEQIFKEAMEAYEILADEDTRERYDKARDARKFGKNSPMNNPEFAEKLAKMREEARRERLRKQNMKADRLEVLVTVSMLELYSGCFKEIKYDRKSKTGEIETVTKNIEVRKGWSPGRSNPIILDSDGHRSKEYQDGDVYCIVEEAEHERFRRSEVKKDLILKSDFCPTFEEGDMLCLVSIETLEGKIVQRVVSYLTLLLSGGGENILTEPLIGMPDPNAPWFDPPGNVLVKVSVPLSNLYTFSFVEDCVCLRNIYMIGNESNSIQAAATAFQVCKDYHDTLIGSKSKKLVGVCISLSNNISQGAETFITVVENLVKTLDWVVVSLGSKGKEHFVTPLLDEEILAIEAADVLIVDAGREESKPGIGLLIAPIDAEDDSITSGGDESVSELMMIAMSFGSGSCGQLAQGESARSHTFREMFSNYQSKEEEKTCPVGVSAGESHSAVLLSNGKVLTSGMGNHGQTGRPDNRNTFALEPIVWDYFISPPKIVSVSCGSRHTLLLDEAGSVWSLGCGKYGQLGHGESYDVNEPQKVWPFLEGASECRAIQVSAGDAHSLICDSLGRAWSWGSNNKGQLGSSDLGGRLSPGTVDLGAAGKQNVCSVSAGKVNSAFLTDQGQVLTCGSCKTQLLGYASSTDVVKPTQISSLSSFITKVEVQEYIAVVLDNTGAISTWGAISTSTIQRQRLMYEVAHTKVAVRAKPSTSSRIAGIKYCGDVVSAVREKDGWIELAQESLPKGSSAKKESLWMLIDGSQLNLGLLLNNVSDDSSFESLRPQRIKFEKPAIGVACFGREILACCDQGSVWSISFDNERSSDGSVSTKELSSSTGAPLNSCELSASTSMIMILSDQSAKLEEEQDVWNGGEILNLCKTERNIEETDQDLEKELERMSALFGSHGLYEMLWEVFLKGAIIVGLGEASSLLGIGKDNCGTSGPPILALIPNVIRRGVFPTTSLQRLHDAVRNVSSRFGQSNRAPYNDVMGSSFLQHACYAWNPKNQSINCFVKAPEKFTQAVEQSSEEYLSLLCLRKDEIGGKELCNNWSHRMTHTTITAAAVGAQDRQRLKQKREESLRHIKEEEYKVVGELAHGGQRSNFDVFGCERGHCNACQDCKGYAQPLHQGIASGSYAFLCACCGCPHSDHVEVVH